LPSNNVSGSVTFVINQLGLSLSKTAFGFGNVAVGKASTTQNITLTAGSAGDIHNLSVSLAGANASDFSIVNPCGSTIAAGQTCIFAIGFTPSAAGLRTATLSVSATGVAAQIVQLSGSGGLPSLSLSTGQLNFGLQVVNTTSAINSVIITNSGDAAAMGVNFAITGSYAKDFVQTNPCGSTIAAGSSCTANITFTPTAELQEQASLAISASNAAQQTITLTGIGTQQGISLSSSGSTSATVTNGQSAAYHLTLNPANGVSGQITLSCSNLPLYASCTFTPAVINLTAGTPASFTLTVSTQQTTTARRISGTDMMLAILFLPSMLVARRKSWKATLFPGALLLIAFNVAALLSGCSSGSPSQSTTPTATTRNTPAGTYTIDVVATSTNSGTSSTPITLVVQ